MKTITFSMMFSLAIFIVAIPAGAQYRMVDGKVYGLFDTSAGWRVFSEPLRVRGFYNNDVICQCHHDEKVNDPISTLANRTIVNSHNEAVWGERIVLKNYPLVSRLSIGDDISGPVTAMRIGDANITSSQREAWHSAYSSSRGSASATTTYGTDESILVYDMGVEFIPQRTPEQIASEHKRQSKLDVKSFRWLQTQATNGDPSAQCSLGQRYLKGQGTVTNREAAIYWLKIAADRGHQESSNILFRIEHPMTNSISDD